jgi:hypothetical protein
VKRFWRSSASALVIVLAACGGSSAAVAQDPQPQGAPTDLPPPGFGSLRQDEIGIRFGDASLQVRVVPLDENVTRLLAPDAWRSLRDMKASKSAEIAAIARQAGFDSVSAFMVTYFALQPEVRFDPDGLTITSQNRTFRPLAHVAITPRFTEGTIELRQQAAAIYLFEPAVDVRRTMSVSYGGRTSEAWAQTLRTLNTERGRVLSRAAQQQGQP